jgi:hypothetical protein
MYLIEAWMILSGLALTAADHTRRTMSIRGFCPWAFARRAGLEGVYEPLMNWSVVTTRFSMRSLNSGLTANQ